MKRTNKIKEFYNTLSDVYASQFLKELDGKPFDQELLKKFANDNKDKGTMADFGCGPGQTTRFLFEYGVRDLVGLDLSDNMIAEAKKHHPEISFKTDNMLGMFEKDHAFGSMIAFYAIVHFEDSELKQFFSEAYRVLKPGGQLLISFHAGKEIITVNEFLGKKATANYHFHDPKKIEEFLEEAGFTNIKTKLRDPYPKEHQSKRAYVLGNRQ